MHRISERSDTWLAVVERVEQQIESLRNALERDADEATTIKLRAKLHAFRAVLTWPSLEEPEGPIAP